MRSRFLEEIRRDMRLRGYAIKTEKTYLHWILRYIYFIDRRHPSEAGALEVRAFLTYLAADRKVAVNTQKIALNSVVYLYHKFLDMDLGELDFTLASKQRQLPTVLSPDEVRRVLSRLKGRNRLIIQLLYGSGLRVNECLSAGVTAPLKLQIEKAVNLQIKDNAKGLGPSLPTSLARKHPKAFLMPTGFHDSVSAGSSRSAVSMSSPSFMIRRSER